MFGIKLSERFHYFYDIYRVGLLYQLLTEKFIDDLVFLYHFQTECCTRLIRNTHALDTAHTL